MTSLGTVSRLRAQSVTAFYINMLNFIPLPKNRTAACYSVLATFQENVRKQASTPAALLASFGNSQVMGLFTT